MDSTDVNRIQSTVLAAAEWTRAWSNLLGEDDVEVLHLGSSNIKAPYFIQSQHILPVSEVKNLRFFITDNLDFDKLVRRSQLRQTLQMLG